MKNYDELPNKISIRKHVNSKGKVIQGDNHYDHLPHVYRAIQRFINSNIGKKFETVYSKFCNEFVYKLDDIETARKWFLFEFRFSTYSEGKYITNVTGFWKERMYFYIDEDGKIAKHNKTYKRDKKLYLPTNNEVYNKADYDKNDWKKLLGEIKDRQNKEERERKQSDDYKKSILLDWIEYTRKKKNPDV